MARELKVVLTGDNRDLARMFKSADKDASSFERRMSSMSTRTVSALGSVGSITGPALRAFGTVRALGRLALGPITGPALGALGPVGALAAFPGGAITAALASFPADLLAEAADGRADLVSANLAVAVGVETVEHLLRPAELVAAD